jgi:hypothetical protein
MKNERENSIRSIGIITSEIPSKEMDYVIVGSISELERNPSYFNSS